MPRHVQENARLKRRQGGESLSTFIERKKKESTVAGLVRAEADAIGDARLKEERKRCTAEGGAGGEKRLQ